MTPSPLRRRLAFAAVCVATALAYAPSFWVPFQFDDYARIANNEALQAGRWLEALAWLGNSRAVPSLTVLLNYRLGGTETFGYHLANLLIHLGGALGVFHLALGLCRTPGLRHSAAARRPLTLATTAALVFACHPLQTQAVTYIIQRYASMAAMFYVWAAVFYVRGRTRQTAVPSRAAWRSFAAAALCGVCAVLSKENAASLPLALLLVERAAFGGPRRWRLLLPIGAGMLLLLAIPVGWKIATWTPRNPAALFMPWYDRALTAVLSQGAAPGQVATPLTYLLTQCTVVPRYLLLVLWPRGLNVDHDVPLAAAPNAAVAAGAALLAALIVVGLLALRRAPWLGIGLLWIFVALSVEASILPISDVMVEHRMYLAMPGVALLAGSAFARLRGRVPRLALAAGAGLATVLVALTFARNVVWQSPLTLWQDAVDKSPNKARVHVNIGVAYHMAAQLDEAVRHYCRALALDPQVSLARENLEIALITQGRFDDISAQVVNPTPGGAAPPGSVLIEVDVTKGCPR